MSQVQENQLPEGKVLVIGGGGFYGRYLVDDLLQFTEAEILVASRHPPHNWDGYHQVKTAVCDMGNLRSLEALATVCDVIVHCAGPFQSLPLNPLYAAIHTGTNYVDISEDRNYQKAVKGLEEQIRRADMMVLSGISVAPAMEALFAEMFGPCFDALVSVRTFAAPDTKKHRGKAMFHAMLTGVGRPFWQPGNGTPRQVYGWTEPEWVDFPPPVGRRLTYLVLEMADLDLLPALFGVKTVEFKAGTEWSFVNRLLGMAARIRAATGHPNWERFMPMVRTFSWLIGRLGKDEGGVIFELSGLMNGDLVTHRIAVMARQNGGLIPSVLASMATAHLLSGRLQVKGIVPVHQWITSEQLIRELQARELEIWWWPHGATKWQVFELSDLFTH